MDLGNKLLLVFVVFLILIGLVMAVSFRERKLANRTGISSKTDDEDSDARTMTIIFGSIIGGMLLALIVAWLVFFS
jgi:ABC-type Fe3+ transport system permease subunit